MGSVAEALQEMAAASDIPADLPERNRRLIALVRKWVATPDDKSPEWWDEFERDVLGSRFKIPERTL